MTEVWLTEDTVISVDEYKANKPTPSVIDRLQKTNETKTIMAVSVTLVRQRLCVKYQEQLFNLNQV